MFGPHWTSSPQLFSVVIFLLSGARQQELERSLKFHISSTLTSSGTSLGLRSLPVASGAQPCRCTPLSFYGRGARSLMAGELWPVLLLPPAGWGWEGHQLLSGSGSFWRPR